MKVRIISTSDIMLLDFKLEEKPQIGDQMMLVEGSFIVVDRIFRMNEPALDIIVEPNFIKIT